MSQFRGFIAFEISPTPAIKEIYRKLRQSGANIKFVELHNLHVTLRFLGDTEDILLPELIDIMKQSIETVDPFTLILQGIGVFPNTNYIKVLWIGLQQAEPLEEIASAIETYLPKLGFKTEKRSFSPHLTIGRVRSARNKENLLNLLKAHRQNEFGTQPVETIKLMKSDLTPKGPVYSTLSEIALS